jgi:hypothetical protein
VATFLPVKLALAQDPTAIRGYTRTTFDQWYAKYKDARPGFKPGDVLTTSHDMAKLAPFIPPGYIELCNFPEFKAAIIPTRSHRPRQDYMNCNGEVSEPGEINADGSMSNYVCGQPFPNSSLSPTDPASGYKASWNFDYRWQNYGLAICDVGWMLVVQDSKWDDSHFYGPNGIIPDDVWSLRKMAVIERTPKSQRAPYSAVVDFFDAENWDAFYMFAWDKKGKLWKVWEFQKAWTEDFKNPARQAINQGVQTTNFQSVQVVDLQNEPGTFVPCYGGGYPNVRGVEAEALYDINGLEQIHR